jgi:uncharacterized membrane protein (UPF0182 family)
MAKVYQMPSKPPRPPAARRRGRLIGIAVAALVLALVVFVIYLLAYTDWLWFGEVGLRVVFWRQIWSRLVVGVAAGAIFFAIFYANVEIARRLSPRHRAFEGIDVVEYVNERTVQGLRRGGLMGSVVLAIFVGAGTSAEWLMFQRALNGVPFGTKDPIFHHDLGFYIFTLPAWQAVYGLVMGALIAGLVAAVIIHAAMGGLVLTQQRPVVQSAEQPEPAARGPFGRPGGPFGRGPGQANIGFVIKPRSQSIAHLSVLLGLIFALAGTGYIFKVWDLLFASDGVVAGAGYTDIHAALPGMRVMMVIGWALGALLIANGFWRRRWRWPLYGVGAWVVALIVVRVVFPAVMQSLVVSPNQQAKEGPYIADNIAATRAAYGLDKITQTQYPLTGDLNTAKLALNSGTVGNIRLWDQSTLLTSYAQLQQLRPYYQFTTVSIDRYDVNGTYRETMLAPRELNIAGLPSQSWVNQHVIYTHGFGAVVSAVNQVASDGSPDFLVQDVPPISSAPDLTITQPRIYYGLLGTSYTLVKTTTAEFDYPGGPSYHYTGSGGIPIDSFLNKLAFSLRFGSIRFFTNTAIGSQSRIIIRNNIVARLHAAAPFLTLDQDPYMVVVGGRLYWIADAYTTTDRYPYSQPLGGINYIRNSVKVVIDAYNGSMRFYVADSTDPIIRTYEKIFPGMFTPLASMPQVLLAHIRYPQDLFSVQSQMFTTYHVTQPDVLYSKNNQWAIPTGTSLSGATGQMEPYYVIMRLPGQVRDEFVQILPFVPNGRPNMIGWLAAQSDMPNYGRAVSFAFPSNATIYGPTQVEAAVNQDPTVSQQLTLWDQQGSHVIIGNLLVMPIEDSLLYVEPLYLQSSTTPVPQLKRVIVFYRASTSAGVTEIGGQQIVAMQPTLAGALTEIFGAAPPAAGSGATVTTPGTTTPTGPVSARVKTLIAQANQQFQAAQAALKAGDFSGYGAKIRALASTLKSLQAAR